MSGWCTRDCQGHGYLGLPIGGQEDGALMFCHLYSIGIQHPQVQFGPGIGRAVRHVSLYFYLGLVRAESRGAMWQVDSLPLSLVCLTELPGTELYTSIDSIVIGFLQVASNKKAGSEEKD